MQTSRDWWNSVRKDPVKLINWLKNQYHGEVTAAKRINDLILVHATSEHYKEIINQIIAQEKQHAVWIATLLYKRGIAPSILSKKERYWDQTVHQVKDWDTGCAVAAHAEAMRLERIKVICDTPDTPFDIKNVFDQILEQEQWHALVFKALTTEKAFKDTENNHIKGMKELGLVI